MRPEFITLIKKLDPEETWTYQLGDRSYAIHHDTMLAMIEALEFYAKSDDGEKAREVLGL